MIIISNIRPSKTCHKHYKLKSFQQFKGDLPVVILSIVTGRKGKHLNTLQKYHIYEVSKKNLHMNDTNTDPYNPIFEELYNTITFPIPPHSP
jgi:hypothetical protein